MPNTELDSSLRHRRIFLDLERKISGGEIADQEQLPVLTDLCVQYGVSAASVRRALDDLERAGLISRQRGRGTFAIRTATRMRTFRVLLIGDTWDLYRGPIEAVHDMFDILAGVRDAARDYGADVVLISRAGPGRMPPTADGIGYLVITMGMNSYELGLRLAREQDVPCVLINPPAALPPCVRVDIAEGARLGVTHLVSLGHRRIGYVGATRGDYFAERVDGYRHALEEHDIPIDNALIDDTPPTDETEPALDRLLSLPNPPTAVFVQSDYRALRVMAYAQSIGLRVPADLSICGYDNIGEAATAQPALTTVHHPRHEQGVAAAHLLTRLMDGDDGAVLDGTIAPYVIVRGSTAPPRS